jgi:tRNA pseudouridine32 synthase / 23S rRNA pseudouridine746 synthase
MTHLRSRVLHRDATLIVLDKPAGLAVHPGPRTPESLEGYLDALRFGLRERPRLVHRLDRDTSGCLLLARHVKAVRRLSALFASSQVRKIYWAVVEGDPPNEGLIDGPLKKVTNKEGWRMVVDPAGQRAVTRYQVLGRGDGIAWLELAPETGRTHQLRVHCASAGFPILGDPVYGRGKSSVPMHLHARSIALPPRGTHPALTVTAGPPEHMRAALRKCGLDAFLSAVGGGEVR